MLPSKCKLKDVKSLCFKNESEIINNLGSLQHQIWSSCDIQFSSLTLKRPKSRVLLLWCWEIWDPNYWKPLLCLDLKKRGGKMDLKVTKQPTVCRAKNIENVISNFHHPKIWSCFAVSEDRRFLCCTVTFCGGWVLINTKGLCLVEMHARTRKPAHTRESLCALIPNPEIRRESFHDCVIIKFIWPYNWEI